MFKLKFKRIHLKQVKGKNICISFQIMCHMPDSTWNKNSLKVRYFTSIRTAECVIHYAIQAPPKHEQSHKL